MSLFFLIFHGEIVPSILPYPTYLEEKIWGGMHSPLHHIFLHIYENFLKHSSCCGSFFWFWNWLYFEFYQRKIHIICCILSLSLNVGGIFSIHLLDLYCLYSILLEKIYNFFKILISWGKICNAIKLRLGEISFLHI